jgi:1A family penicillin-binding protein
MRIYNYKNKDNKSSVKKRLSFKFNWKRKNLLTWFFRIFAVGLIFIALTFAYYAKDLPDPNKLLERKVAESTKIYARDNSLLYEIHGEAKRTLVNLDQISPDLQHATIAIEDKDFYNHHGLYFKGIFRSIFRYAINLGPSGGGGSTLTQQFVKNAILNNDKSFDRKIREAILSLSLEAKFSKNDILKLYLNEIPYGRNAYGIEAAAQSYFNKDAKDLTLAQSAYLAALPQSPSRYNPLGPNRKILDGRKDHILSLMREQGYINAEQEKKAKEEKVEFTKTRTAITAPHFVFMVQDYLAQKFGEKTLQEGGLKVYTTLDPALQKIAEEAVKTGVEKNGKKYNANNASLVAIDPKTGQILALVGSKDYFGTPQPEGCTPGKNCLFEPNVNVAISERQPGSSFKPYVYVTAFGKDFKYAPATMLLDVTTNFGKYGDKDYIPQDYDGKERGPISMRSALAGSLNIPAVKTLALVGVDNAVQTARNLGITSPLSDCGLSLVLGGCEVKLIDHVAAYSSLANGGVKNEKTAILKIEDSNGKILEEFKENPQTVLDPQAVYLLTSIMTDNTARTYVFGPNSPLILPGRKVAAKTGTTQKWHDGWTLGFTPSLAAGVWTGNNDGTYLKKGADGVLVAAPIWHDFMEKALKDKPAEDFFQPVGIKHVVVDELSGKLPTTNTPSTKDEVFADYSVPTQTDDVHQVAAIDSLTNQPATNLTPPNQIIYEKLTVLHSEKPELPAWENAVIAWALANGYKYPQGLGQPLPPDNNSDNPSVNILEPLEDSNILSSPFNINVSAAGKNSISRVDVYIDGNVVASLASQPYFFTIYNKYPTGQHTIAVKAVDILGKSADTSVNVNFGPANNAN